MDPSISPTFGELRSARKERRDMAPITELEHLANPLVTVEQLYLLQDDDRGRAENGQSVRYAQALLTQAAGVLLRLPQEVVATSLVLLQRFWIEGHGEGHATADLKVHKSC